MNYKHGKRTNSIECNKNKDAIPSNSLQKDLYTRNELIASENIQVTLSDGRTLILKGADSEFPYGKFTGTIIYAKRSKIAIDFIPD